MHLKHAVWFLLACMALMAGDASHAQTYPTKPIRMIVPTPPGGPIDALARLLGDRMAQELGQPVVIENRPSAGQIVGSKAAASAAPDGYTLLFGTSSSLAVTPALYKDAGYDAIKSFAPVSMVAEGAFVLAVNSAVPAKSVAELVTYAKANPGKLNYGSGVGIIPHVAWAQFKLATKTDTVFIPYKGSAPALTDLLAGRTHFIIDAPGALLPHIEQGKLRGLAITSSMRSANLSELPTMVEVGYPDFVVTFWTGVVAPAGTPEPVIARLNNVINDALRSGAMRTSLARFGVEPRLGSPRDFAAFITTEAKKWADIIVSADIVVQ